MADQTRMVLPSDMAGGDSASLAGGTGARSLVGNPKDALPTCCICDSELSEDDQATCVACPQGHFICAGEGGCAAAFVVSAFEPGAGGRVQLPPPCPICNVPVLAATFEMQLTPAQRDQYILYTAQFELLEGERIVACPFCSNFEVWDEARRAAFFNCTREGCHRLSCVYCKLEVPRPRRGGAYHAGSREEREMDLHLTDHEPLGWAKRIFDKALDASENIECPYPDCRVKGRKDDNCTHMRCVGCRKMWCYVCGKTVDDCNKASAAELARYGGPDMIPIARHNVNWRGDARRCPMFFLEVNPIDPRWPAGSDAECLARFHRLRALTLLREAREQIEARSAGAFDLLWAAFPSVANAGYTQEEIRTAVPQEQYIMIAGRRMRPGARGGGGGGGGGGGR